MKNVMTWIIGITLTLGMIGLLVLGQVSGARDISDKANNEQTKLSLMISDSNIVTGKTILKYMEDGIDVKDSGGANMNPSSIDEASLYTIEKFYSSDGELSSVKATLKDLSK